VNRCQASADPRALQAVLRRGGETRALSKLGAARFPDCATFGKASPRCTMLSPEPAPPQRPDCVASGYDAIADEYVRHVFHELDSKPFDRDFLDRFAASCQGGDLVLDLGCGPGHVGRYLGDRGALVCGVDISARMLSLARQRNPELRLVRGDMRSLPFACGAAAGIVAFYSIIHVPLAQVSGIFSEMFRVLRPGGTLAIAFHVGDDVLRVHELWGVKTELDFFLLDPEAVRSALAESGFRVLDAIEREPYDGAVEAQTRRCYVLAQRVDRHGQR
jgi:SAM-dependent methyltransferase